MVSKDIIIFRCSEKVGGLRARVAGSSHWGELIGESRAVGVICEEECQSLAPRVEKPHGPSGASRRSIFRARRSSVPLTSRPHIGRRRDVARAFSLSLAFLRDMRTMMLASHLWITIAWRAEFTHADAATMSKVSASAISWRREASLTGRRRHEMWGERFSLQFLANTSAHFSRRRAVGRARAAQRGFSLRGFGDASPRDARSLCMPLRRGVSFRARVPSRRGRFVHVNADTH